MRVVLHVSLPVENFNKAVLDGTAGPKLKAILEQIKPEAVYFCAKDGKRGGFVVADLKDPSDMPRLGEPWFLAFDATVEILPAMTPEDLAKAGLEEIAKKWK
ncbi:MAG: panthothenate synthetase [Planctomycetes bacterium]|nr:panthothenate synthetase [Planctomycetota bacterium]